MRVILEILELKKLLLDAATLGAQQAEKDRDIANDEMSSREAYRWMKAKGLKPSLLDKFVEMGLVKPKRKGPSKNSARMYSRLEMMAAISARDNFHLFVQ